MLVGLLGLDRQRRAGGQDRVSHRTGPAEAGWAGESVLNTRAREELAVGQLPVGDGDDAALASVRPKHRHPCPSQDQGPGSQEGWAAREWAHGLSIASRPVALVSLVSLSL